MSKKLPESYQEYIQLQLSGYNSIFDFRLAYELDWSKTLQEWANRNKDWLGKHRLFNKINTNDNLFGITFNVMNYMFIVSEWDSVHGELLEFFNNNKFPDEHYAM